MEHDRREVGLVEISYPKGYKKRFLHNTLCLDSEEITFPLKHYESMFDRLTNIPRLLLPSIKENFICIFSEYINKYQEQSNELFSSCRGETSIVINENFVSSFPARVYNGIEDLAENIMNLSNCRTSLVMLPTKHNLNLLSLNPYAFTQTLSNQIWFEILMYDY